MNNTFERTAKFRKARYGFFLHYLNGSAGAGGGMNNSIEAWNRRTDAFDVEKLARRLHELGAGYCFITLGQNSGFYCSPNATYDAILDNKSGESKCSKRDLFMDLADALTKYDIPLYAYTTDFAPATDDRAVLAFDSVPLWDASKNAGGYARFKGHENPDPRMRSFLTKWEAVHREWAERFGKKCAGWWVDGCYFQDKLHNFPDAPNSESWAGALRAGNPEALVTFNPGVCYPPKKQNDFEDYTAGEINEPWRGLLNGPLIDGLQYHVLTYAGKSWGTKPLMYSGRELAAVTGSINARGGVVTWDVPFSHDGDFLDDFHMAFAEMKRILDSQENTIVNSEFKLLRPPSAKSSGEARIFTDSPDAEYLEYDGHCYPVKSGVEQIVELPYPSIPPKGITMRAKLRYGEFERSWPVPVATTLRSGENYELELFSFDGNKLGDFDIQIGKDALRIQGKIYDREPKNHPVVWQGSCVEFIFSSDALKGNWLQLFGSFDGRLLIAGERGSFLPFTLATLEAGRHAAEYYKADFTMPFTAIPGFDGKSFRMELHANVSNGDSMSDGTMFGAVNVLGDLDRYATVIVG